jgi:hypothetical protein
VHIDRTHRVWLILSILILAASTVAYVLYALEAPHGARGGSAMGLVFGFLGYGFMIYAGLLGARKKVPVWRLGRAQTWMRGHLWLGLLALPIILFHGGFHFGGPLTAVLLWLLIITVISGVFGAILQHYLPRAMMDQVQRETVYDEIPNVRKLLRAEAEEYIEKLCGSLPVPAEMSVGETLRAGGYSAMRPKRVGEEEVEGLTEAEIEPIRVFYVTDLLPFLEDPDNRELHLADEVRAHAAFSKVRMLVPPAVHPVIDNLEDVCSEVRQLGRQLRLHRLMHGWLLVHVPLSVALLLLSAFHAVVALRY